VRLRIEYQDHNDSFGDLLPRTGEVLAIPACSDSTHRWHVLRLDEPLAYEARLYDRFLIASRWVGCEIGEPRTVTVFILLVPSSHPPIMDGFSCKDFLHVAWGGAQVLP